MWQYGTSHNKVTVLRPYVRLYSYLFNARTPTCSMHVPVPVPCLYLYPYMYWCIRRSVAIAISYEIVGVKRTEFDDSPRFVRANVLLRC